MTVGADYRINEWLLAGLALNYTNYDGTYDDSGGSDKHIFGPLLYATFVPFEGAFANVILGYARQENRNNRLAERIKLRSSWTADYLGPEEQRISEGHTSADYSENQYTVGILAGYDQPFGNVTIGPRLGLFSHEQYESLRRREIRVWNSATTTWTRPRCRAAWVCKRRWAFDSLRRRGAAGGGRLGP